MNTAAAPAERTGTVRRLATLVHTGLAVAGLFGVAYWGHKTDWTFVPTRAADTRNHLAHAPPTVTTAADGTVTITFPSAEAAEAAGVEAAPVWRTAVSEAVAADGEIHFDPNRVTKISPRAAGTCVRVLKKLGDPVQVGEVLAVIDAADVGKAKADLLHAIVEVRLKRRVLADLAAAGDTVPVRQRADAEAAVRDAELKGRAAEQQLTAFGLPVKSKDLIGLPSEAAAAKLRALGHDEASDSANLLPVRAPSAGTVLEIAAAMGEAVETGRPLFVVVDPSRVLLTLHVPGTEAGRIAVGQGVTFRSDGSTRQFEGKVNGLVAAVDPATRTLSVRVDLDNADGQLRANALGRGMIVLRVSADALTVPNAAVQTLRGQTVVFVRDRDFLKDGGAKSFRLRPVRLGTADAANTEILTGLAADEVVTAKGSAILLHEAQRMDTATPGGGQ